jgi:hypothetical protein
MHTPTRATSIFAACLAASVLGLLGACGGSNTSGSSPAPDAARAEDAGSKDSGGTRDAHATDASTRDAISKDGGVEGSAPEYPAPHPAAPQVVTGGVIDSHPKIVSVSFAGDPLEADIDTFAAAIGTTTYWGDRTKEYGIAPLSPVGRIHDPTVWPASTDDSQIQAWLIGQLDDPDAGWPAADKDTIFALYFPPGVSITNHSQGLPASCGTPTAPTWHGYHDNVTLPGGQLVPYAIISRCDSIPEDPSATGIQYVSAVTSHEVIEAITDPFVTIGQLGYFGTDPDHLAFELATGAELGDMCALVGNAFYTPPDFPYVVQRIWSNSVARTGHDPCLPEPAGQVYFNSVPVLPDTIRVPSIYGVGRQTSKGVKIPKGQKGTVEVDLFSEAPTPGPWTVRAFETDGASDLSFSFDKSTGQNGDKLKLTITVAETSVQGAEAFIIVSTLGTQLSFWAGFVGN